MLASKGEKNVYEVERGLALSITAMFAFSNSGMMCPPLLKYPYKRLPFEITHRVPDDWCMTKRCKMFEETVGSELIMELKIGEGKMRQNLCSRDRLMH